MSERYVQPLRLLVQTVFLLLCLIVGFRFYHFALALNDSVTAASRPAAVEAFLPISGFFGAVAWLKGGGINPIHPAAVVFFVTIIAVSFLLRRAFCSWICPIGTLSEWLWKLGFNRLQRNWLTPRWFDMGLRSIKYLLLAFFSVTVFSWSLLTLQSFLGSEYHVVSDIKLLNLFRSPSVSTLAVLCLLAALSVPLRNPFCRFICPYGALLGLFALLSPLAVQRDQKKCVSCGVCSQVCPSGIDVMHASRVSTPECLGCWRCISHCRVNTALGMRAFGRWAVPGIVFALFLLLLFWGGTQLGKSTGNWDSVITPSDYRELLKK